MRVLLFLLALLLPPGLTAQVAYDTVYVTIEGQLTYATILVNDTTIAVGDTIQFVAQAFDIDGDPVTAQFTWMSSDTTRLTVEQETGLAVAIAKDTIPVAVYLMAEQIGTIHIASYENGELTWGYGSLEVGQYLQFCAYLVSSDQYLLAEDPGPPTCPIVFLPRPEPDSRFASVLRVRKLITS